MALNAELSALLKGAKNRYSGKSSNVIKLKEGFTTIRILQSPSELKFWRDVAVHWIKPDLNSKAIAVVGCADHTYDQPCVICTALAKAQAAATTDDEVKLLKEMRPQKKVLVNALILDGPDKATTAQIVEFTPTTFGKFLDLMDFYMESSGNILDPQTGIDFVVSRKGRGLDTEYNWMVSRESKPVPAGVLESMHDLDAFIQKEYFRGEENKALAQIEASFNIELRLAAPTRAAALTGPASATPAAPQVIEAQVIAPAPAAAAPVAPVAPAAPAHAAPLPWEGQAPAQAATVAAPAAPAHAVAPQVAPAPAPAAPVTASPIPGAPAMPTAELDSLLAELDGV